MQTLNRETRIRRLEERLLSQRKLLESLYDNCKMRILIALVALVCSLLVVLGNDRVEVPAAATTHLRSIGSTVSSRTLDVAEKKRVYNLISLEKNSVDKSRFKGIIFRGKLV